MLIWIVRHGETALNKRGVLQGRLDEPLDADGRKLAELTGRALAGTEFTACWSSPLKRALETAQIILRESGNGERILTDERLLEIDFGEMEGKHISQLGAEGRLFFSDPFAYRAPRGGESVREVCERTQGFLKELIRKGGGGNCLVSVHGCALRAMLNFLYEDPSDFWHGHVPYNCSLSVVEAENGSARLVTDDAVFYPAHLAADRYGNGGK